MGGKPKKLEIRSPIRGNGPPISKMKPPLLPSEALPRVIRVARFDGVCVLGISGFFALVFASSHNVRGAVVGLLIAAAGAVELHGVSLLRARSASGMRWLIFSQVYLLGTILAYAAMNFISPRTEMMRQALKEMMTPEMSQQINDMIQAQGLTFDQFIVGEMRIVYAVLAAVTVVYQGGMMLYYLRRRAAVEAAAREPDLA
jgi:hypothetical protein